jgi:hypothetical protein
MSDQPEALFLADVIENDPTSAAHHAAAAAELRRLRAERDALRVEVARLRIERDALRSLDDSLLTEFNKLHAECDALRADAARWRAVRGWFRVMSPNIDGNHGWCPTGEWGRYRGITIDAVADAARAALKEAKE